MEETRLSYKNKAEYLVKEINKIGFNSNEMEGGMFLMVEVKSLTNMNGDEFSKYVMN